MSRWVELEWAIFGVLFAAVALIGVLSGHKGIEEIAALGIGVVCMGVSDILKAIRRVTADPSPNHKRQS